MVVKKLDKRLLVGIKNLNYMLNANIITFFISTMVVLIIPKMIGVPEYGMFQLYIFYTSYAGFLLFGWNDGIYLRFGGYDYDRLDKTAISSQFYMSLVFQIIIFLSLLTIQPFLLENQLSSIKIFILTSVLITNSSGILLSTFQATNKFKQFSISQISGRLTYIILTLIFVVQGTANFITIIVCDLIGKVITFCVALYFSRDIVCRKISDIHFDYKEAYRNISVGIKLMFANIASMLIIGFVRFGIERTWDVATFGKVSLTLSISNMMMIFINAVGIIMFPILRRTNHEKLSSIYSTMRDFLMVILLGFLIIYYPLKTIMVAWLPQYAESLLYMSLVFPIFIYEGKMALLINTYLNTLRREKVMLKINLFSMVLSLFITYMTTQVFVNLELVILNIVILLSIRSVIAECYLARELNIKVKKDIVLELLLTTVFIVTGWFVNSWMTVVFYGIAYMCYLLIKRKDIIETSKNIKSLIKA